MEKHITDGYTGLKYELVGDYYLVAGYDKPEERPIGICEQRHLRYLKQHQRIVYAEVSKNSLCRVSKNSLCRAIDKRIIE